jgi:integrase
VGAKAKWRADRGAWYVFVDDGGRSTKIRVGADQEAAEQAASSINATIAARQQQAAARATEFVPNEPINGEQALRWWRARYPYKRSTGATIDSHVAGHLLPFLQHRDLRKLSKRDLRQFIEHEFGRGCSHATVRGVISTLRRLLNVLVDEEYLAGNPVPKLMAIVEETARAHPEARPRGNRDSWTKSELEVLISVAKDREPDWHPVFLMLCETGMRISEAIGLKWEAVDFENRSMHVREAVVRNETGPPKWGKARHVPISEPLLRLLRDLARKRKLKRRATMPDYVLLSPTGRRLDTRNVSRAWFRIRDYAHAKYQVRLLVLHSFRHTWATLMLRDGQDPQWVAAVLGDRLDTVLKHYSHVLPMQQRFPSLLDRSPSNGESDQPRKPHRDESLVAGR